MKKQRAMGHHDGARVARAAAVVAGREERGEEAVVRAVEPSVRRRQLVRPHHQRQVVVAHELLRHVGAESYTVGAAVRGRDPVVVLGVRPHGVEHDAVVPRHGGGGALPQSVDRADVLDAHRLVSKEAAVDDEEPVRHQRGQGQQLEELLEHVEDCLVTRGLRELGHDLVVEAAAVLGPAAVDLDVLVVAAVDHDGVGVEQFVQEEDDQNLRTEGPAVDDVAVHQVPHPVRRLAIVLEDVEEVLQLPVRVAAHHQLRVLARGHLHVVHRSLHLVLEHGHALRQDLRHVSGVHRDLGSRAHVLHHFAHVGEGERPSYMRARITRVGSRHIFPPGCRIN
mmetsp:Transcript_60110/g.159736  ORF Transcript_60110/g.159736 Transcript_60110/m.159736 type:complete len:337 (-) Transcript_60110:472-1482(-)